jgi:hypothetical protein
MEMRHPSGSEGFALPLAILILTLLTATLAAAFAMASSEYRAIDNARDQEKALRLAQSGLETFLASRPSLGFTAVPPAVSESARVALPGGYADVTLERIRPSVSGSPSLYVIRSKGVRTDPELPGTPAAERMVAQYAQWQVGSLGVGAAFTSLTGLHKNGSSGTISGTDQCGALPGVAGVAVPTNPGYTQNGGGAPVPTGSPPIDNLGSFSAAADATPIDWQGIVDGTALVPDVTIPSDAWPSFADPNDWPVILVHGDFALPGDGQGTLIVTGDLTINGSKDWQGIILAGGHITGNGNNGLFGAMVSGLNVKLGNPATVAAAMGSNTIGNGVKRIYFDSCNIASALAGFGGLVVFPNAWADNLPVF